MLTFFVLLSKYVIISSGDFMDRYALGNFLADLRNEKGLTRIPLLYITFKESQ